MRSVSKILFLVFAIVTYSSCKEPFEPKINPAHTNYLVVEGTINASGITTIRLSRTIPLNDSALVKPETRAQMIVEGEDNSSYIVRETETGIYNSGFSNLNKNLKYRLHVKTASGGEYLSAFVPVKTTPPIDSVSWERKNGGVQVYVSTHDQTNNNPYYKWEYEETWEIHSTFPAEYVYNKSDNTVKPAPRNYDSVYALYYCWQSENSMQLLLGSTVQLTNNVVSKQPIQFIPDASIKTNVRYSILVKQYSLDQQSYDFNQQMKKNTESLGSIFDALPSESSGNISCVSNPAEKVIGFVSASTVEQKRIFITKDQIGGTYYSQTCDIILVANDKDSIADFYGAGVFLPFAAEIAVGGAIKHYYSSLAPCIDCRLRGTNVKPSYW